MEGSVLSRTRHGILIIIIIMRNICREINVERTLLNDIQVYVTLDNWLFLTQTRRNGLNNVVVGLEISYNLDLHYRLLLFG